MKSQIINIRVSDTLKEDLDILCNIENTTLSNLGRKALQSYYESSLIDSNSKSNSEKGEELDLLQSLAFTELVFWIYDKKRDPEICELEDFLIQHFNFIQEAQRHPRFIRENSRTKKNILNELRKLSIELGKYLDGVLENDYEWLFPNSTYENAFDYEVLADFMSMIRYDDDSNKNLFIK